MTTGTKRIVCSCDQVFTSWFDFDTHWLTADDGQKHTPQDW